MKKCFYAYPANPLSRSLVIESAIKNINDTLNDVFVEGWKDIRPTGKFIIDVVFDRIDNCDVFMCDLTYMNRNVLFELGYAIATKKRIWISADEKATKETGRMLSSEVEFLTTLAHSKYSNAKSLADEFIKDAPYNSPQETLLAQISPSLERKNSTVPKIFYLKSENITSTSKILSRNIVSYDYDVIVDDPVEVVSRPLQWYIENVKHSLGIIAHFLSDSYPAKSIQNEKYSLVCGLAVGFGKSILMIAKSPHDTPIDYKDYLTVYNDTNQCLRVIDDWFKTNKTRFDGISNKYRQLVRKNNSLAALKDLDLGEYVAEDELADLSNYFIETASYEEAKKSSNYLLFVRRKGTGKTANLTKIATDFSTDDNIFVCSIKPIDYELEGIFRLFDKSLSFSETSNLIETLWKFLIYTEIACQIYNQLLNRGTTLLSEEEQTLKDYIEGWGELILSDFTVRLEKTVEEILNIDLGNTVSQQRLKVSEVLHSKFLSQLQLYLNNVLNVYSKVVVLIDNLDKSWNKHGKVNKLATFLYSLLNVGDRVPKDFIRSDSRREGVELSLIVFLRSDIFNYVLSNAREPDKLKYSYIEWNNPILLQRLVEKRFLYSANQVELSEDDVWSKYFAKSIDGVPTKQFLVNSIIPRPRDIIFVCKHALINAINHLHTKIERDDLLLALREYSKHVYFAMLAETEVIIEDAENLFIAFAGLNSILTRNDLIQIIEYSELDLELDFAIEILCDVTFLGLEIKNDIFEYIYDSSQKKILKSRARRTASSTGIERYKINIPFYTHLGIES